MLQSATIQRYQSVEDGEVDFGRLTVLVGPSNSGKSALLRALRTLARNTPGSSHVTVGRQSAAITLVVDDTRVILERGKGPSTYRLITPEGEEQAYPKSGTTVPVDIERSLAMPLVEGQDLHFAFQFDRPFLLSEPGSTAARVLGDLTNVNLLHEAARSANTRRLQAQSRLKVQREQQEAWRAKLEGYDDVRPRKALLEEARRLLDEVTDVGIEAAALQDILEGLDYVDAALSAHTVPDVWDASGALDEVEGWVREADEIQALVDAHGDAGDAVTEALAALEVAALEVHVTTEKLQEMGVCPTCGQAVA